MQEIAWNITVWLVAVLAASFVYVAMKSKEEGESASIQSAAARVRTVLFWTALVAGVPVAMVTLADLPYAAPAAGGTQVVEVTGHQWYWEMSERELEAGRPVEFRVGAADATHGFAVYDASMTLIAQTQAMPEYINVLRHTFAEPGTYKVVCLEYCGLNHHVMTDEITVTARTSKEG